MISHVHSITINGLESTLIDIEVDINNGLLLNYDYFLKLL